MRIWTFWAVIICKLWAVEGLTLSSQEVVRGQTVLFTFSHDAQSYALSLRMESEAFYFLPHPYKKGHQYLLLPIGYDTKSQSKILQFDLLTPAGIQTISLPALTILQGNYKEENLHVAPSKVTLSKKDQIRALKEHEQLRAIYEVTAPNAFGNLGFGLPMETPLTSSFGNARLFNNTLTSYHSGVDFKAQRPMEVYAVAKGTVALNATLFYAGGSVIIDHGDGIFSSYSHLSHSHLVVGSIIEKDALVGLSGQSGRVTGPHLHFGMSILGVKVDPLQLIELLNNL